MWSLSPPCRTELGDFMFHRPGSWPVLSCRSRHNVQRVCGVACCGILAIVSLANIHDKTYFRRGAELPANLVQMVCVAASCEVLTLYARGP